MTPSDLTNLALVVFTAGLDTIVSTMAAFIRHFALHPELQRQLRAEADSSPRIIEELLRRYPIFSPARLATTDTLLCGISIRQNDMVVAPTAYIGFDGLPDPLRVDFHREKLRHAAFGVGVHRCIGAALARLELRVLLREWLCPMPEFSLVPTQPVQLSAGPVASIKRLEVMW